MNSEELRHGEDLMEAGEKGMPKVCNIERKVGGSSRQLWPTLKLFMRLSGKKVDNKGSTPQLLGFKYCFCCFDGIVTL